MSADSLRKKIVGNKKLPFNPDVIKDVPLRQRLSHAREVLERGEARDASRSPALQQ
jgi:hypothetical protein